jgi:hypothetical protein
MRLLHYVIRMWLLSSYILLHLWLWYLILNNCLAVYSLIGSLMKLY